jgi:Tol biopolymer transport system component
VACALVALSGVAQAEIPAGPRLTFMESGPSGSSLISADPNGGDRRVIVGGDGAAGLLPLAFSSPAWSADGSRVAFSGVDQSGKKALFDVYDAAADGTGVIKLPGTVDGLDPVLSPDGGTLAFTRLRQREARRPRNGKVTTFQSVAIWLLNIESGAVRQLTPWRNGLSAFPSSFSPDGTALAITRDQRKKGSVTRSSAVALRLDGSGSAVLAEEAGEPVYSPDGTRLALITRGKQRTVHSESGTTTTFSPTELAVANADGSGLTKLTHTGALELLPGWDPSGQRLAYTLFRGGGSESDFLGIGDSIMEINSNGSCRTKVLSIPNTTLYGATWQPGPGREVGPIAC